MHTRLRRWRAAGLAAGSLATAAVIGLAIALLGGASPKPAEAGDLASMLALMQSIQAPSAAPGTGEGTQALQQAAAVDYFLKIDGIEGESTAEAHRGEIEITSFSLGVSNSGLPGNAGGGGAGKVSFDDFRATMPMSVASPSLFLACAGGEHIDSVVLTLERGLGKDYMKITLTNVLVTSYHTSGSTDVPTEQISLNFEKIEFEYRPQKKDGSLGSPVKVGYDLKLNKKV